MYYCRVHLHFPGLLIRVRLRSIITYNLVLHCLSGGRFAGLRTFRFPAKLGGSVPLVVRDRCWLVTTADTTNIVAVQVRLAAGPGDKWTAKKNKTEPLSFRPS
ncbi:hypothetical protein PISMIDRAFT_679531 [Pisolithus microcarpus 441]|uniref:Uncharacterized protein n=1 Tax=Pisolithus microcarpus 441 TaxID=765257 RepID=A0A0C9YEG9_9AGAM|nr:hypothetical protein PISMIDRAFT_679531 [Pisolithus microcarpus 441]